MKESKDLFADSIQYQQIVREYLDTQSVKQTAVNLSVSEVRVRKVLITEQLWSSKTSLAVQHYLDLGKSTEEIADILHTTVKAVQQYLPYSRGLYNRNDPTRDSIYSAEYRNRIRVAQEKTLKRSEEYLIHAGWKEKAVKELTLEEPMKNDHINNENSDLMDELISQILESDEEEIHIPQYDGIVCLRELPPAYEPERNRLWLRGADIIRLHLELRRDGYDFLDEEDDGHSTEVFRHAETEEETRVLKSYGKVSYGDTISRDILIPSDMPLYALHYMIQQAFGWENSHLHRFELPMKQFLDITDDNAGKWASLVGLLFRSPWMEEGDMFWADDYESGSFKNWLRKKYTGPYLSLCHGEGIMQCTADVEEIIEKIRKVMVEYSTFEGKTYVSDARPADANEKTGEVAPDGIEKKGLFGRDVVKREVLKLEDCSAQAMIRMFMEGGANHLLERLPLEEVLALHGKSPEDEIPPAEEYCSSFEEFMDDDLIADVDEIFRDGLDSPDNQPMIYPVTDVLYYFYDYGDGWRIRITGSYDACDLVEQGRVTQEQLDQAIKKIHETYRPVCIAADGLPLVDDVGGISGYCRFLRAINPAEEKAYWGKDNMPDNWSYENKKNSLEWARSLGWRDKVNPARLL